MSEERRISIGPLVGIVGALLLLVSLFLDWYEEISGFTVFEVLDLVLAALAIAAAVALANALGARLKGASALGARTALPIALLAFVIVVSQLLNDPPAVAGGDSDPDIGIWLGLAGALLLLAGALLSVARISLALDLETRQGGGGPASHGAEAGAASPSSHEAPTVAAPATGSAPASGSPTTGGESASEEGPGTGPAEGPGAAPGARR